MNHSFNSTFIVLILKKCNANTISDFRPISLYNVLYKLVSKTITNRFNPIMHAIISNNQSAFILEMLITKIIMVTHELLHTLKKNNKRKVGKMTVKLDMSKAYDIVKWPYLKVIMKAIDLKEPWIKLVMSCASTVSYSIFVNGKLGE